MKVFETVLSVRLTSDIVKKIETMKVIKELKTDSEVIRAAICYYYDKNTGKKGGFNGN